MICDDVLSFLAGGSKYAEQGGKETEFILAMSDVVEESVVQEGDGGSGNSRHDNTGEVAYSDTGKSDTV